MKDEELWYRIIGLAWKDKDYQWSSLNSPMASILDLVEHCISWCFEQETGKQYEIQPQQAYWKMILSCVIHAFRCFKH